MADFLRDMMYSNIDPVNKLLQHDQDIQGVKSYLADIMTLVPKPNGTDDTQNIKDAIAKITSTGGTVKFPSGQYKVMSQITVPANVNLVGTFGTEIQRRFNFSVGYAIFILNGNNVISGLKINGGSDWITVNGTEFTNYADLYCQGDNITIQNNILEKSCGSSIVSGQYSNNVISFNRFGDYKDHSIYISGNESANQTRRTKIINNHFSTATSTRETVKLRNGVYETLIGFNTFNVPLASFITLDVGGVGAGLAVINDKITVIGNMGYGNSFLVSLSSTLENRSVSVVNNNVETASYGIMLGLFPASGTQQGAIIKEISFIGNEFLFNSLMIFNGHIGSIGIQKLLFKDNKIHIKNSSTLANIYGEVTDITIENNVFSGDFATPSSSNSIFGLDEGNTLAHTYKSTTSGKLRFKNNIIKNVYQTLLYENTTNGGEALTHWDIFAEENTHDGTGISFVPINVLGTFVNNITNKLYEKNNRKADGTISASSWSSGNKLTYDNKVILTGNLSSTVTVNANSTANIDIPITGATGNDVGIANPQFGGLPVGIVYYCFASTNIIRVVVQNITGVAITLTNVNWLGTVIRKI